MTGPCVRGVCTDCSLSNPRKPSLHELPPSSVRRDEPYPGSRGTPDRVSAAHGAEPRCAVDALQAVLWSGGWVLGPERRTLTVGVDWGKGTWGEWRAARRRAVRGARTGRVAALSD